MAKELSMMPMEAIRSDGKDASLSPQFAIGSGVVSEWEGMPASDESAVCQTPALELFSQACAAYIDCELGAMPEWQCNPPMLSMTEFAVDGSLNALQVTIDEGRSVDAALPLLLDEIEEFIATLRDESENDFIWADRA
jgi:hypothetical protein